MSVLSESLTIGLLLTLVFGALFFYLYSRVTYAEKRVGLMENILIDIKMKEETHQMHMLPQVPSHLSFQEAMDGTTIMVPHIQLQEHNEQQKHDEQQEHNEQQKHDEQQEHELHELKEEGESQLQQQSLDDFQTEELYSEVLETANIEKNEEIKKVNPVNYEAMTKDELIEIAKKKGLRVGNRPGREKLLQIIRQSEELSSDNVVEIDN